MSQSSHYSGYDPSGLLSGQTACITKTVLKVYITLAEQPANEKDVKINFRLSVAAAPDHLILLPGLVPRLIAADDLIVQFLYPGKSVISNSETES